MPRADGASIDAKDSPAHIIRVRTCKTDYGFGNLLWVRPIGVRRALRQSAKHHHDRAQEQQNKKYSDGQNTHELGLGVFSPRCCESVLGAELQVIRTAFCSSLLWHPISVMGDGEYRRFKWSFQGPQKRSPKTFLQRKLDHCTMNTIGGNP
jgi:hypothetical protein